MTFSRRTTKALTLFSGCILATSISGCINLTPDLVVPIGSIKPLAASQLSNMNAPVETTIKTAKSGDILMTQPIENAFVLVLRNTPETEGDIGTSLQGRTMNLESGQNYYPAITLGQYDKVVACSFDRPITIIPKLAPNNTGKFKACFIFDDLSEDFEIGTLSFDQVNWVSSEFFLGTEEIGDTSVSSFQYLSRWEPQIIYKLLEPAQFDKRSTPSDIVEDGRLSALRFVVTPTGPQIEPSYLVDGEPRRTKADPVVIDSDGVYPTTVEIGGAKVEILALTDDVLAYRILSGRPVAQIAMDLE